MEIDFRPAVSTDAEPIDQFLPAIRPRRAWCRAGVEQLVASWRLIDHRIDQRRTVRPIRLYVERDLIACPRILCFHGGMRTARRVLHHEMRSLVEIGCDLVHEDE